MSQHGDQREGTPSLEQLGTLARSLEFALQVKLEAEVDIRLLKIKMQEYSSILEGNGESLPMRMEKLWLRVQEFERAEEKEERKKDRTNARFVAMISILPSILSTVGGFLGYLLGRLVFG